MSEHAAPSRSLSRHPRRLAALLCLAVLAGCGVTEDRAITYATWKQAEPTPQPRVERIPVSHVVAFAPPSDRLSDVEREALLGFLRQTAVQPGDAVVLTVPPPEAGQADPSAARLATLRSVLAREGISATTIFGGGVPGLSADAILVTAQTLAVVAPECPGYNAPLELDFEQKPNLSFGCANAANLGLMVANPADLVEGRPLPPADGEAATLSIQRYRAGTVWPSSSPSSSVPLRVGTE